MNTNGARASIVCAGIVGLLALAGCGSDEDLAEVVLTAEHGDVAARVWIPINEPRSTGTYRADVNWADGVSDRVEAERDGMLTEVWLTDLTGGSEPELVVASSSAGSGSYGSVDVYSRVNGGLETLELAALDESLSAGYMGHDTFAAFEGALLREFPLYQDDDTNAEPSGGTARFRYDFDRGEWLSVTLP